MEDKTYTIQSASKQQRKVRIDQEIRRVLSHASIDKLSEDNSNQAAKFQSTSIKRTRSIDNQFQKLPRSIKQIQSTNLIRKQQPYFKKVLVLYASGSSGANQNIQIHKGFLKSRIKQNRYLCDEKFMQNYQSHDSFLVTPQQQNKIRILYDIEQFPKIVPSSDMSLQDIKQIAFKIKQNYKKFDSFIVLCGLDVITYISTMISFMLQNLSKLIIFTGGYFPIAYMRNDTVNNLNQSFSIISFADNFNDVIIVCKNKGYRANRSIKMNEGSFGSVASPNLPALVSVNIKIKFREHLYLPVPKEEFYIHTDVSCLVGIIKYHILVNKQALAYELSNPAYDGFVIQSYGSSNLPMNQQILQTFKRIAEDKNKIFINVAQPVQKVDTSVMKQYLQKYHIYFGGDMTTQAALSKLSYLLSKKLSRPQIKRLIYTSMRGELTEVNAENQFQIQNPSFMELVEKSLQSYYPSNLYEAFIGKIQDQITLFLSNCSNSKQIEQIFKKVKHQQRQQLFKTTMVRLIDSNNLLHYAVKASNENLYKYCLSFNINCNKQDENECSPLFYAIVLKDKKAIQYLSKSGCKVICHEDQLFNLIIRELKQDNVSFFELLYHVEFKQTLKDVVNYQGRNVLHLAALLKAHRSLAFILQKFKFNLKHKDNYHKSYQDYLISVK